MTNRLRRLLTDWWWLLVIFLGALLLFVAAAAWAQDVDLPIDTIIKDAPGSIHHIAVIPAEPGIVCTAELTFGNNPAEEPSTHPNNDILVGPVTFTDVENGMFKAAGLPFTTTGPIDVAVRLGGDGVFSGGFTLEVTCNPPTTTTPTTTPTTSSTTATPTPAPSTTTTTATVPTSVPSVTTTTLSPPPVGGIETGGGACDNGSCDGWGGWWWVLGGLPFWILAAAFTWALVKGGTDE